LRRVILLLPGLLMAVALGGCDRQNPSAPQGNGANAAAAAAPAPPAGAGAPPSGNASAHAQYPTGRLDRSHGGTQAPDLSFQGPDGRLTRLSAFRGRPVLVNLWATWCVPCRQEMPALDRLQAALGGDDFAVVPVSIDIGNPDRPAAFLQSIGIKNLPLYTDRTTKIFEELKARGLAVGLPVTVLLDRKGCALGHINGPAEWDSADGQKLIDAAIRPAAPQS
jgi:thiol-disulfide isomerase/thioredoxin